MRRGALVLGALLLICGCAGNPPPPERLGRKIAVLPVNNRTGEALVVSGDGLLDRYVFRTPTATLVEVLEGEAAYRLREKGFEVPPPAIWDKSFRGRAPEGPAEAADMAAKAGLGPLCLYLEVRRWEAEGRAHVNSVTVDVQAMLIDVPSGKPVWTGSRRGPVPTPGVFLLEAAYISAARIVVRDLLAPLSPSPT